MAALTADAVHAAACEIGFDLVGVADCVRLEAKAPLASRPSAASGQMRSLVVVGKRILRGLMAARHLGTKQFWGGRSLKRVDEMACRLADWIERRGGAAMVLSSLAMDFADRGPEDVTPAGQGSLLLRLAAVDAGLGTLGLNTMLLTPAFGPRVHLGGVLTDAALEPGTPLGRELCLGLAECGRCAAICPEDAIPRRAPAAAPPGEVRGLDCAACARSSQPFGPAVFTAHLARIFGTAGGPDLWKAIKTRLTGEMWQEMLMVKEGAFTGCAECVQVCPVGADYVGYAETPHRARDFPDGVPRTYRGGMVEVGLVGPQVRRTL
jgi:epoxyqueuosine reductase QueG